ncbi:MAG: hypothetical protein AAF363_18025 [Bacteroidota bacterium]
MKNDQELHEVRKKLKLVAELMITSEKIGIRNGSKKIFSRIKRLNKKIGEWYGLRTLKKSLEVFSKGLPVYKNKEKLTQQIKQIYDQSEKMRKDIVMEAKSDILRKAVVIST